MKVLQSVTLLNDSGEHNKTYSIQLTEEKGVFTVSAQHGRRGFTQKEVKSLYEGSSKWSAENAYGDMMRAKKGSRGYDKEINPPILPVRMGGIGTDALKAELPVSKKALAKRVETLNSWLNDGEKPEKEKSLDSIFGLD